MKLVNIMSENQYIVDSEGNKISVILSVEDFEEFKKRQLKKTDYNPQEILNLRGTLPRQSKEEINSILKMLRDSWE